MHIFECETVTNLHRFAVELEDTLTSIILNVEVLASRKQMVGQPVPTADLRREHWLSILCHCRWLRYRFVRSLFRERHPVSPI